MSKGASYLATLSKDEAGDYVSEDGVSLGDASGALRELFGFCGCGCPDAALAYVRDAMRLVAMRGPEAFEARSKWYKSVKQPAIDALFHGNRGAEYFMWYMLDSKELTEHGGSVPGWLTPLGESVLFDLNAMDEK